MIGGNGSDTLFAGAGSASMTGGASGDMFAFFNVNTRGNGNVITDFGGEDVVFILGYDPYESASKLQDNAIVDAGGVTLTLSDSTTITFSNLTSASQLDGRIFYPHIV